MPDALRAAGATAHTMADIYGERMGQGLSDEEWLRDAGRQGWVVLMKDAKVRHRPAQRLAIETYAVRAFVVKNANLTGPLRRNGSSAISTGSPDSRSIQARTSVACTATA